MTLNELANALGVPARQIRFLIAEGILPPAYKTGRAADGYDETHLALGKRYQALYRMGMKPGSIKVLMAFDDAIPVFQDNGIELRIGRGVNPEQIDIEDITQKIERVLAKFTGKEETDG